MEQMNLLKNSKKKNLKNHISGNQEAGFKRKNYRCNIVILQEIFSEQDYGYSIKFIWKGGNYSAVPIFWKH